MADEPPPPLDNAFRSGFVALLGEPNVGKSTLLNRLLDFKVAIVSPKPQTTRDRIAGIHTDAASQIVFVDAPGVMAPRDRFNTCLRDRALEALAGADVVYHLVDAARPAPLPPEALEALAAAGKPTLLVANKIDRLEGWPDHPATTQGLAERWGAAVDPATYRGVFAISALEGAGLEALVDATRGLLPVGPALYDPDDLTDRDLRFLAAEVVREKVLACTHDEVPYAVATRTEEFVERGKAKHRVRVVIYVEHDSQKAILIGRDGAMLREIGSLARPEIEQIADHPIFLELWVKVLKNWRKDDNALRRLGFRPMDKRRKSRRRRRRPGA